MNNDMSTKSPAQPQPRPPSQHLDVVVIGTGTMGSAVAGRLLQVGMTVGVWNRGTQRALALAERGAMAFYDPADAVVGASVVVTLLPTAEAVAEVMLSGGVIDAMAPRAVWAQMGTIGIESTEALDLELRHRRPDVHFVDAPVSGSRDPAESGQLLVLASGPAAAVGAAAPVFDAIGRRTLWLGPAGTGSRLKLVLNTWLAFEVEAAAEAAALAEHFGITPEMLVAALDDNPLASPLASAKLSKMRSGDDRPDFPLEWALKDLDLASAVAGSRQTPVAAAIADRWRTLVDAGFGSLDVSAARLGLAQDCAMAATIGGR